MYAYLGSDTVLTLPESYGDLPVTSIASRCFEHADLTSVSIPDSYTQIGSYAFYDCQSLQDVQAFADVNDDSRVSVEDVTLIQRYIAGYDDGIF